jgi:phenylpropionate dioxygenase-like ring-hydroxylating dioxygenase large terminal subunit
MSQEKQTAEEIEIIDILVKHLGVDAKYMSSTNRMLMAVKEYATLKLQEKDKYIETLTRVTSEHTLEQDKIIFEQAKEIERLKGEKQLAVESLLTIKNTLKDLFN